MVFQSYALYPNMNVAQNIAFGLEMRKVPKAEREAAVQRVAKMLQIEHLLDRKPGQLSGGQRQRVAMGRALARDPKLFLFDEPLSNLDAKLRVEMRAEIKLLHQRTRTTTVYVTHDQVEAMTLGDRIAVMKDGVVQQLGSPTTSTPAGHALRGRVHRLAGDELSLQTVVGSLTARVPGPVAHAVGETVQLRWSPAALHGFDTRNGQRLPALETDSR
jgi:ABC-type sulfate/molybdate transport systems ATPase subunit